MTSVRKRKKTAAASGFSEPELRLAELLDEVLDQVRWLWVLAYGNQYLLNAKLSVGEAERDRVLEAATRAVAADGRLRDWQARLARLKQEAVLARRGMRRANETIARERRDERALAKEQHADGE